MAIYNNCRMTHTEHVGNKDKVKRSENCTVTIGVDNIHVAVRFGDDDEIREPDQIWQGDRDSDGIFRLKYEGHEDAWANLCWMDGRLIGTYYNDESFGLWMLDLG